MASSGHPGPGAEGAARAGSCGHAPTSDARAAAGAWSEDDSLAYLRWSEAFVPRRAEIARTVVALLPPGAPGTVVDLGGGDGWLAAAVLRARAGAAAVVIDGSPAMRAAAQARLAPFGPRADVRAGDLRAPAACLGGLGGVWCAVSCLALHHLTAAQRGTLYAGVATALRPGGGLLVADMARAGAAAVARCWARLWEESVAAQRPGPDGAASALEAFQTLRWNSYAHGFEPEEHPLTAAEDGALMRAAGFASAEAVWSFAGHYLVAAYR